MSLPRLFDHPLSLWDSLNDSDSFWSSFARLPKFQDDNGDTAFMPPCEVIEGKKNYKVNIELPGFKKDDIHVSLHDGVLQVEAESSSTNEEKEEGKIVRSERRYGKYMRRFNLGKNVKDDDVKANFKDGLLNLTVPKQAVKEQKPAKITID